MLKLRKVLKVIAVVICISTIPIKINYDKTHPDLDTIQVLEIYNDKGVNNQGCLMVSGDVKNVSTYTLSQVEIVVTFYDDSDNTVATSKDVCNETLTPDDSYHFKVNCLKKQGSKYSVEAIPTLQEKPTLFDYIFK